MSNKTLSQISKSYQKHFEKITKEALEHAEAEKSSKPKFANKLWQNKGKTTPGSQKISMPTTTTVAGTSAQLTATASALVSRLQSVSVALKPAEVKQANRDAAAARKEAAKKAKYCKKQA